MKLEYKTDRLPVNFVALGYILLAVGSWRIIVLDWKGILIFFVSILLLFLRSGIIIDTDKKRLKKYDGIFFIKKGKWENIEQFTSLQIVKIRELQTMSVLSKSTTTTNEIYKLYLNMPDDHIELMSGNKKKILKRAKRIASSLHTSLIDKTDNDE